LNIWLVTIPPMFARGIAGPLGKLICAVKTKIDDVTYSLWLQHCAARGLDTACVHRDCIYAWCMARRTANGGGR
jgi:hypothetical protein